MERDADTEVDGEELDMGMNPPIPGLINETTEIRNENVTTILGDLIYVNENYLGWTEFNVVSMNEDLLTASWPLKVGLFSSDPDRAYTPYENLPKSWVLT